MDSYKKLIKNSFIFTVANISSKLLSFFLVPYYTYVLSTDELGVADALVNTVSLILPIVSLYIQDAVLRYIMEKQEKSNDIVSVALKLFFINYIVLLCIYPILKYFNIGGQNLKYLYFLLLFQGIYNITGQYVRGKGKIKEFAFGGVINTFVLLVSNIVLLTYFKLGIQGYLCSFVLAYLLSSIYYVLVGDVYKVNIFIKSDTQMIKYMLQYSIPLIPNALMWWIMNISDRYMLIFFIGPAASGIYTVAHKIPTLLNLISSIFSQAWQLSAIEENNSRDKEKFYTNVFSFYSLIMYLASMVIISFIRPIIQILVEKNYSTSAQYVPFLMLAMVFSAYGAFLGMIYAAEKKTRNAMISTVLGAVVNIVMNFILIPLIGINGAAIGTMVGLLTLWIYRLIDTKKYVKICYDLKLHISFFIISIIQIIIFYKGMKYEYFVYILLIVLFFIINKKMLVEFIKKLIGKLKRK